MITEQCVKSNLSYHITIITIMGTHIYDVCEKRTTLHKVFFANSFPYHGQYCISLLHQADLSLFGPFCLLVDFLFGAIGDKSERKGAGG